MQRSVLPSALGPNPTTDEIDKVVHDLIDRHFSGEIDEPTTRREITGALYVSGIHKDVADRRTELTQQARADLADMLLNLLIDKMINGEFYSLVQGRRRSACGWARQVAKSAVASELRNARRSRGRNGAPADPTSHEFTAIAAASPAMSVNDAHSTTVDGDLVELVEAFTERTKGMRETDRVVACAETLCEALGVSGALRPGSMVERDVCLRALAEDESLAYRSLRAWASTVHAAVPFPVAVRALDVDLVVGETLLSLWDDQTEDSTIELLARPSHVAHMLAAAAVSPLPRPPKKSLQKVKTIVMAGNGRRDREWRELASSLVDAYAASQFEAVSQYATISDTSRWSMSTGHCIDRSRLDTLVERAAMHPTAPLGRSRVAVLERLAEAVDIVIKDEARPVATSTAPKVAPKVSAAKATPATKAAAKRATRSKAVAEPKQAKQAEPAAKATRHLRAVSGTAA